MSPDLKDLADLIGETISLLCLVGAVMLVAGAFHLARTAGWLP